MSLLPYLHEYIKINYFFVCFLGFLFFLTILKYFNFKVTLKPTICLFGILLLGLMLRIGWLGISSHEPLMSRSEGRALENDMINIHAIELTKGVWFHDNQGQPTGRRPIGYPMFLALLYQIFGIHINVVWTAQLCLYLVTAFLIYQIGRIIFFDQIGLLAAFLFSIYPCSIYSIKLVTDEHLLVPIWYFGFYLLFKELKERPLRFNWLWYGIVFGYSTMIRTHTIFMPLVVGIASLLKKIPLIRVGIVVFLTALTMQLINLPWVIRNYKAWGVLVLYTATGPFVYSQLNFSAAPEGGGHIPISGEPGYSEELEKAIASSNEGLAHRLANREMSKWLRENPLRFLEIAPARLLEFMGWNRKSGVWPIWFQFYPEHHKESGFAVKNKKMFEELAFISYYIVLFSTLISVGFFWRRWARLSSDTKNAILVLGSVFLFYFLEHTIIYPDRKYRFPLESLMILISSYFFYYLITQFRWFKKISSK